MNDFLKTTHDNNTMNRHQLISIDIVIPIYNEQEALSLLLDRLEETFSEKKCESHLIKNVRYIFLDDGSSDNSLFILKRDTKNLVNSSSIISFSRNFGHQAAVSAGVHMSKADVTAIIDADLQDPPEHILSMLGLWRDGFDVVYGQRKNRKEAFLKKICYKGFYRLFSFLSPVEIAMDSGDFCVMGRNVVDAINSLPENQRFNRGLRSWVGFSQVGFEYNRPERQAGKTKYSFTSLYKLATDGIASLSIVPLKASQLFAIIFLIITLALLLFMFVGGLRNSEIDFNFIVLFTILFGNIIILLCLYTLAAYIGRGYLEIKKRPLYIVKEIIHVVGVRPAKEND